MADDKVLNLIKEYQRRLATQSKTVPMALTPTPIKPSNQLSPDVINVIKKYEGFEPKLYPDQAGKNTIGYGHLLRPNEKVSDFSSSKTDQLTQEDAENLLYKDIQAHQGWKNKVNQKSITPKQEAALTSLAFNLGPNSPAISQIVDLINQNKHSDAAKVFNQYNKVRDPRTKELKESKGLTERRQYESSLFSEDITPEVIEAQEAPEYLQNLAMQDTNFQNLRGLLRGNK